MVTWIMFRRDGYLDFGVFGLGDALVLGFAKEIGSPSVGVI